MRSRAEARRAIEIGWRVLALVMLAWALLAAFRAPAREPEQLEGAALPAVLPRLTRAPASAALEITFVAAPAAESRAWLAALQRAGGEVVWRPEGTLPPLALEVLPRADPAGGARALVAAMRGDTVRLDDAAGPLDTLRLESSVVTRRLPAFVPPLIARTDAQVARAAPHDSLAPHRVLVLGGAEWEGKFLLAALEERGWLASARFTVAPGIAVAQGTALPLDTAHFAAVIVLDSSAAGRAAAVAAFVRQGGGLVLAGDAARNPRFAPLAPGVAGPRVRPASLAFTDSAPRRALALFAITALKPDAIPLELRDGRVAAAARRAGIGRVVQVGYDESWRWRFAGGVRAPEAHRAWWAEIVSSISYRATLPLVAAAEFNHDAAPLAQLVAAVGPSAERRVPRPAVPAPRLEWWLLALILIGLLAETASRRFRGAP